MATITLLRTNQSLPNEEARGALRGFLFGVVDGLTGDDKRSWKRFWTRVMRMAPGELAKVEAVIPRNPRFHRKFFALLNVGFEAWEPERKHKTHKGYPVAKNFEQFREDVTILAGFYEQTFDLRGRMVLRARSISFTNMDDTEFEGLYSAVADVLLGRVLTRYANREELDAVVERIMGFV